MDHENSTQAEMNPAAVHYDGMQVYDINQPPFRIYGLCRKPGETDFKRLPYDLGAGIDNECVRDNYMKTAGGRIRFRTDSRRIVLRCGWPALSEKNHMPMTGTSCFDLYADGIFCGTLRPADHIPGDSGDPIPLEKGYQSSCSFPDSKMREILIHFPLYNDVSQVWIALDDGAQLLPAAEYTRPGSIVYYGSSITQGACASHAGNAYEAIIARRLDMDFVNLGFAGGCRAEPEMASYLAGLDMKVFVYDYDHNAPKPEFLEATHERLFRTFRQAQPETPVLMISVADHHFGSDIEKRKAIIRKTYDNARAAGDQNVYFLDGQTIYEPVGWDLCTVDNVHPTDLGLWCMAKAIGPMLESILNR